MTRTHLFISCQYIRCQVLGDTVGVSAVLAAMLGLSVLLLTGVLTWKDCLTYPAAWDTLFWFAVLVGAPGVCCSSRTLFSAQRDPRRPSL